MNSDVIHIVYEIYDPRNGDCIYVGKGNLGDWNRFNDHYRFNNHLCDARNVTIKQVKNPFKARLLRKIIDAGLQPILRIVGEYSTEREALDEEIRLIAHYGRRDKGLGTLTNLTDGGEGTCGYIHTQETKQKISEALTGTVHSMEVRNAMSESRKGRKHTDETKKLLSEINVGRKMKPEHIRSGFSHSEETKKKIGIGISKALKGKPKSRQHVENQAAATRGRKQKPEHIRRGFTISDEQKAIVSATMSRVHKGVPKSPEHREKIGAAQRGKKRASPSEETRRKLSESGKGKQIGVIRTPEHRAKISATLKARHAERRKAAGIDDNAPKIKPVHAKKGKPWTQAQHDAFEKRKQEKMQNNIEILPEIK
jgi:hypothetical protein